MRFGVLGPLLVRDGDGDIAVPAARQRVLLAALVVRAGRVVPADELSELVWDGVPPAGSAVTLRSYITRLRQALGPRAGRRVVTRNPGYLLDAAGEEVDLLQFTRLCQDGSAAVRSGSWARASSVLSEALGLWRGAALVDIPSRALRQAELPYLEELRLQALEWRIDAGLHLGRHAELVPELQSHIAGHPLRERFHAQLMLALYRCGRQADALAGYRHARQMLVDELGAEPGAELRSVHERILALDPALAAPEPVARGGALAVPRQLPAAAGSFVGRAHELATLTALLCPAGQAPGTVVISAVGGTAGVGKTALAVHWAHRVADRFPDGQLYVNLRGFDPSGTPVPAAEAVRGFLDALGVPPERIPPTPEAQAGLYRSLLADRKMLIVLDNIRDEQQARPLLPASGGSLVLATSRCQLAGLAATDGARLLSLDVLAEAEARQLLAARIGTARSAAEPEAVSEIAGLCGCLPLALAVAAARAAARPRFTLAALAAELRDAPGRLDALDAGDPASNVRSVFSWSYQQLTSDAARMFRLLGIHPGPDFTVPAAASLAGVPPDRALRHLGGLARAHLITEHLPGRYALHDLLRAYAAEQARRTDTDTDRREATGRALDHYLHTAARAALMLMPAKEPVVLAPPRPGVTAGQPAVDSQALAWFEAEHQNLLATLKLAAGSGFDCHAWQLPWAMAAFLEARGYWQEWAATQHTALAAATRLGDTAAQAMSSRLLANACGNLGDYDGAAGHYASSLTLYQRLGNRLGEAKILQCLGVIAHRQGCYADALGHSEQALRLFRAIGDKASQAIAINDLGWCHSLLGDYKQARAFSRQGVSLIADVDNPWLEAGLWDTLGYAEHHLGNLAEATACYQHALSVERESGLRFNEATTLTHLGDTRQAAGELAQAREAWQQALIILDDLEHPDAGQIRAKLAGTDGQPP